jgi:adenylate kinase family enzyme
VRVLLLAPPGAGKGTQGERLAARFGVRHIAAGDLLRAEAQIGGRLGREIADYLYAPETVLTRRLLARASQEGRADDTADVIRHRLQVFAETTGPLLAYYRERGILVAVDADQPPESVTAQIESALLRGETPRIRSG